MTNSIPEIRDADFLYVTGSNTTEAHPIIAMEMKRAVLRGARLAEANLVEAILDGADLSAADLTKARLIAARLVRPCPARGRSGSSSTPQPSRRIEAATQMIIALVIAFSVRCPSASA